MALELLCIFTSFKPTPVALEWVSVAVHVVFLCVAGRERLCFRLDFCHSLKSGRPAFGGRAQAHFMNSDWQYSILCVCLGDRTCLLIGGVCCRLHENSDL